MDSANLLGKPKLNQKIGIRSKPRVSNSLPILNIVYHSLFGSNFRDKEIVQIEITYKLQNQALRKITFKKLYDPVNPLYKNLKIHFQN